jgi:hypothetical protein
MRRVFAVVDLLPVMVAPRQNFWVELWFHHLRNFCLHVVSDVVMEVCILIGLAIFWQVIRLLHVWGLSDDLLQKLEYTDFCFVWASIVVLGITFVLKLGISIWRHR